MPEWSWRFQILWRLKVWSRWHMGRHRRTHLHRSQRSERDIQRHTYKHKCRPLFRTYQSCVNVLPQAANVPSQSHWWGYPVDCDVFFPFFGIASVEIKIMDLWTLNIQILSGAITHFSFFKRTFSWTLLLYIQRPCIFFAFHTWSWRYLENFLRCFCCGSLWEVQTLLSQHILEWKGRFEPSHDMGMADLHWVAGWMLEPCWRMLVASKRVKFIQQIATSTYQHLLVACNNVEDLALVHFAPRQIWSIWTSECSAICWPSDGRGHSHGNLFSCFWFRPGMHNA